MGGGTLIDTGRIEIKYDIFLFQLRVVSDNLVDIEAIDTTTF